MDNNIIDVRPKVIPVPLATFLVAENVTVQIDVDTLRKVWQWTNGSLVETIKVMRAVRYGQNYIGLTEAKRILDYCRQYF